MSHFFRDARNVAIHGPTSFVAVQGGDQPKGLDLLRQHIAPGALLDSIERFDPPKCSPDTRVAIVGQIATWAKGVDGGPSMMWLHGPAGAGKSALGQTIAERFQEEEDLAASFFFNRTILECNDGNRLIPTMAYQLISSIPETRPFIKTYIEQDPVIFLKTRETQMKKLLLEPLNRLSSIRHPRLIVIDGLDECTDVRVQCDLLVIVGNMIGKLTFPIRVLITSRSEAHIRHIFDGGEEVLRMISVSRIDLAEDRDADRDIRAFLEREFEHIRRRHPDLHQSWPSPDDIQTLVRKSSGQFIFASTVIRYLKSLRHRPNIRLQIILGLKSAPTNDAPFATLDALYSSILSSSENIDDSLKVLGILLLPEIKDDGLLGGLLGRHTPLELEKLLSLEPGGVRILLMDLASLVTFKDVHTPVKILHASLADYLLNPARSKKHFIDTNDIHEICAKHFLRRFLESDRIAVAPDNLPLDLFACIRHCEGRLSSHPLFYMWLTSFSLQLGDLVENFLFKDNHRKAHMQELSERFNWIKGNGPDLKSTFLDDFSSFWYSETSSRLQVPEDEHEIRITVIVGSMRFPDESAIIMCICDDYTQSVRARRHTRLSTQSSGISETFGISLL